MRRRRPYGSGSIEKLPSGRYRARIRVEGQWFSAPETFDAKVDAQAWCKVQGDAIVAGTWHAPPKPVQAIAGGQDVGPLTLRAYAGQWMRERPLKPRTAADYQSLLDKWILPTLGDFPLTGLTPAQIRSWYSDLALGRETTRAHAYGLLRTILGTAVDDDLIPANPCRIRGAGSAARQSQTVIATVSEVELIADNMPDRLRAMVWLAAWCGLRYGELAELRRKDLNLNLTRGTVTVARGVVRIEGRAIVGSPKSTAGVRRIAIPPHVVPLVQTHLDEYVAHDDESLLFPSDAGTHLPNSTFYGWYYPARKAAGRPDLRFHDLRHTQATLAAMNGATLAELMQRLGHSTPGAALRYQHVAKDRDRELARRLSAMAALSGGGANDADDLRGAGDDTRSG